ncbi:MAG: SDR family oxidoreductase [Deinococcota bacterium]|jgi:NAD(P)-dependent dehydrogenase (short-subunit alcohol dehydrogenase family)|nr:SDR family oxidoreductase [Deinococcota bacterium]
MQLEDRVAVITGAGSGIGEASARLFAKEGARIAALSHTEDEVKRLAEELERQGHEAMHIVADISEADAMKTAYEQVVDRWGRLDVVFANAGINGLWAPIEELGPDDWDETLHTNLRGTFLTIKYAVPHLKARGGSVLVTSSVNGTRMFSNTGATAYAVSKAGQVAMTKMLAVELAKHKIRVNVICPGAIDTDIDDNTEREGLESIRLPVEFPEGMIPLTGKEAGTSEQVAQLALFLASDMSSHITGTEVWIDGAQSLLQG